MYKYLKIAIVAVVLCGCAGKVSVSHLTEAEVEAIRSMCNRLNEQYPAATMQDVYKTCYQDFFGAEHLLTDTAAAHKYLTAELSACVEQDLTAMPAFEPTGFRQRFVRVNLSEVQNGRIAEETLMALLVEAGRADNIFSDDWESEWQQIEQIALDVHPAWSNEELQAALKEAAKQKKAVHHSETFRNNYHPHYRIVKRKEINEDKILPVIYVQ